jgi:hypothetical protein
MFGCVFEVASSQGQVCCMGAIAYLLQDNGKLCFLCHNFNPSCCGGLSAW